MKNSLGAIFDKISCTVGKTIIDCILTYSQVRTDLFITKYYFGPATLFSNH